MAQAFKVIVPDQGRTVLAGLNIPPFGTVVYRDDNLPDFPGRSRNLHIYRPNGGEPVALYDDEVEQISPTKSVKDVVVEAAGTKLTFTGSDSYAGYIVAGIIGIVVIGIAGVGRFAPDVFNIVLK